ncbi:hypothetical protein [Kitasatospora sp. NPDC050543]|uniref:hypothetical protein n=1 Tax=Kitasatospora sp. NPDC050543 TaxID=3364054 RepID=UPI0037AFC02A
MSSRDRRPGKTGPALLGAAVWWLWMPVGALLIWVVKHFVFGGFGQQDQSYLLLLQQEFFPHSSVLGATALFWLWITVGLLGTLAIIAFAVEESGAGYGGKSVRLLLAVVVLATLGSAVRVGTGLWDNDKDLGRFYARATVLDIPAGDNRTPRSVLPVAAHSRKGDGTRCDLVGTSDVPACVKVAPMPDFDFDPRTASFTGASTALANSAGQASGVQLMRHSIHYLPTGRPNQEVWTAVLDGSGEQPIEGVAIWDGRSNTVSTCSFRGDHSFDRAFGGAGDNSLRNLLSERFPDLVYSDQDIWGYCDGADPGTAAPVIVISVERQTGWAERTVLQPAGVLLLTGSPDGKPVLTYRPEIAPRELPGAAYPASVVRAQIAEIQWLGGRGAKNESSFGYEHTSAATNAGNPGEFLLRSATDGHLYYVTPLVPRDSSSQLVVAFAVVQADRVGGGLNDLHVYVRGDDSPTINIGVLASRMVSYFGQQTSMAIRFGSGGQLQEIIPFGRDMWRGFVDIQGQTQDYIDLSGDATVQPNLVAVNGSITPPGNQPGPAPSTSASPAPSSAPSPPAAASPGQATPAGSCGGDTGQLSTAQLAACIAAFSQALQSRVQATPSPG